MREAFDREHEAGAWQLLTKRSQFDEVAEDWQTLYLSNPLHSPFQAWGWVAAWLSHLAGEHELRILTWRTKAGKLQLILPLVRSGNDPFATERLVLAGGYGPECSDYLGCLFEPSRAANLHDLIAKGTAELLPANAKILLRALSNEVGLPDRLGDSLARDGRRVSVSAHLPCPRTQLADAWDEFLMNLSANFRSQVRRCYRKVVNSENLSFRRFPAEEAGEFTELLISLNRARIAAKGKRSSLEDEQFRLFMLEAVPYMAQREVAWMDAIDDDSRTIGATLNFVHGSVVYFYMSGFDEQASRHRPGTALFAEIIRRSIDEGYRYYDFLRGAESYKYKWGARDMLLKQVVVYPENRMRAAASWFCNDLPVELRRQARKLVARSH